MERIYLGQHPIQLVFYLQRYVSIRYIYLIYNVHLIVFLSSSHICKILMLRRKLLLLIYRMKHIFHFCQGIHLFGNQRNPIFGWMLLLLVCIFQDYWFDLYRIEHIHLILIDHLCLHQF